LNINIFDVEISFVHNDKSQEDYRSLRVKKRNNACYQRSKPVLRESSHCDQVEPLNT